MVDRELLAHQEWLGLIQPVGLVVVPKALMRAGVVIDESARDSWRLYSDLLSEPDERGDRTLVDFVSFAEQILRWRPQSIAGMPGGPAIPDSLVLSLPELQVRLEPTFAVPDPEQDAFQLLVRVLANGTNPDRPSNDSTWTASPQDQFERLLRETGVGAGLLVTDRVIRFVYAPRGESSGYLSFPVSAMGTVSGRPMFLAMTQLLSGWRLSRACPSGQRLGHLLRESRKYQNDVSTQLAEQVLDGLYVLLRGIQAADDAADGEVLRDTIAEAPQEVYGGLLTTIMRMVFVLYAEERGMLPQDASWVQHYGVGALYEQLSADRAQYPDTMEQRYGAWARLLALTRILHDGARHGAMRIPARAGELFDPDRYPFLEGRPWGTRRVMGERLASVPRISDGCVLGVLERLLVLDGERLSYRALDVEQIGSVYEAMMGFEVKPALGMSVALVPKSKGKGAPAHPVCDLDALLRQRGADRVKWLKENCDVELPAPQATLLKQATGVVELLEALQKRRSPFTPQEVRRGGLVLHPTEERRRSGSHYTPRELTEPIVATTLRPIFEAFGGAPTPEQILALKVCDPAMGSGAFLVGACRYLGDKLVEAWQRQGHMPPMPPDEDPQLYARRLVAQQCLYGVDRNAYAVQLAKLSLWLVTLAREHPFTFLDHALRHGDSLVGLTYQQITTFHWAPGGSAQRHLWASVVEDCLVQADGRRDQIEAMADSDDTSEKQVLLREADAQLDLVRRVGDAVLTAFFGAEKEKARESLRSTLEMRAANALGRRDLDALTRLSDDLRAHGIVPFHWEVEFPEVFRRSTPGFDAFVGNPPFAGKNTLINGNPPLYLPWLQELHEGAHGNADLVAHFFRRAYGLLREGGSFGLIATNTIAQGDTRATGLRWLRQRRCTLYEARRRYKWPGAAAVVVSVVHGVRGAYAGPFRIDGKEVPLITAFLFHAGSDEDPAQLAENAGKSFQGSIVLGMGFTFDDDNPVATPIAEMHRLIAENPRNQEVIYPYIGGEEVNNDPMHRHRRYVINLGEIPEGDARRGWPELMSIVEAKVKPERDRLGDNADARRRKAHWWQWGRYTPALSEATRSLPEVLVTNCGATPHLSWVRIPSGQVFANSLAVVADGSITSLAVLQSRLHELWARFFGSSMKDDLRYTLTDCFETFPFPLEWQQSQALDGTGRTYYDYRAQLMVDRGQGLTDTYNRFHNPEDQSSETQRLRDLHAAMDRAVLDAYGWTDLNPIAEFIPEFDEDEIEPGTRAKRKYRLRWPDEVRDEVLARLLDLNRERATGRNP